MRLSILLAIFLISQILIAQTDIHLDHGDTLKIHPIGDSITRGAGGDNYRRYLKLKLKSDANVTVDFVGQCPHAADYMSDWADYQDLYNILEGDVEHDGWGGLTIQQIMDMTNNTRGYPKITIEQMITDSPADIILLMIGTNNKFFISNSEGAEEALQVLIGRMVDATDEHIIVSTIPPTSLPITNGRIEEFNATVPTTVDSFKALGANISFIDINSYMDPVADLLDDQCHPNSSGDEHIADGWFDAITSIVTDVNDKKKNELPTEFGLKQNYPNPFNPSTKIAFSISTKSAVTLKVFDSLGKELQTLLNEVKSVGEYEVNFDASRLTSGVYYYQLITENFIDTKRMILLK